MVKEQQGLRSTHQWWPNNLKMSEHISRIPTRYWKYWISKLVFKTLKKYWLWPKCALGIGKVWTFSTEKQSEVSEQNFTEGKALHCLCRLMQCAKL